MNFKNKIVYELYPMSFKDSNNDGIGDIQGIISKLDYLADLGIDIIWITPIFESPKNDNGYDISNYYKIDPTFGSLEDVKELIKVAKSKNIEIMFDMVLNHTSTKHEWFQRALKGEKKYQDFYFFKKTDNTNVFPNNWISKFGGPAWNYNPELKMWNLALFDKTQADLNWNNPEVRKEIFKILNFWLDLGVAGFRLDVINLISKPEIFENADLKIHDGRKFYTDGPRIHEFLKELNKNTFGKHKNIITVGEMSSTSIEQCILYSNPQNQELSMVFNFHHLKVDYENGQKWSLKAWNKKEFKNILVNWQTQLTKNNGNMALFLNNHDQPRVNSRFGDVKKYWYQSSTIFAALIMSLNGVVYIYQGEEIGMTNPNFKSIKEYRDVESLNAYQDLKKQGISEKHILEILNSKSRDNSRTPFQWDDSLHAGFSIKHPWINVAKNYLDINLKKQIRDSNSVFNFYKKLIKIRKENQILIDGEIEFLNSQEELFIFKRIKNNSELLCCFNLTTEKQNIENFVSKNNYEILITNKIENKNNFKILNSLEFVILELKK